MLADVEQKEVTWEDLQVAEDEPKTIEVKRVWGFKYAIPDDIEISDERLEEARRVLSERFERLVRDTLFNLARPQSEEDHEFDRFNAWISQAIHKHFYRPGYARYRSHRGWHEPRYRPEYMETYEVPGWIARVLFPQYQRNEGTPVMVLEETMVEMFIQASRQFGVERDHPEPLRILMAFGSRQMHQAQCTPSRDPFPITAGPF